MSEGQWIESGTLDLWESRHREQLARIKELEAKLKTSEEIGRAFEEDAGQLRAKLAKAVEMLAAIIDDNDNGMFVQDHTIEIARTTLAELKGEDRG